MRKLISALVVLALVFVDFLFFHDFFKPGETISLAQYLTGAASLGAFYLLVPDLYRQIRS